MTRGPKITLWIAAAAALLIGVVTITKKNRSIQALEQISITGVVLRDDTDPRKQLPVANTEITATAGASQATVTSNATGLFTLTLRPGLPPGQILSVTFKHAEFETLHLNGVSPVPLLVARMKSTLHNEVAKPGRPDIGIKDVRLRYSVKQITTMNVASAAQAFEVVNTGNVPCSGKHPTCSPDSKWRAKLETFTLDAREGNVFQNARISCVAGPCPFTRIESDNLENPGRTIKVSVRNWSDTTTFLIEAEVTRTQINDLIRTSYPVIFGSAMSFTLPAGAEGPSIEAGLNASDIVFPLGPDLKLSWATCTAETAPDHTRLFQCELKPGYQFR